MEFVGYGGLEYLFIIFLIRSPVKFGSVQAKLVFHMPECPVR
jgi:hypothetical protein